MDASDYSRAKPCPAAKSKGREKRQIRISVNFLRLLRFLRLTSFFGCGFAAL
jgi:hypothetical protein